MGGATLDAVTHKMNGSVLLFECANEVRLFFGFGFFFFMCVSLLFVMGFVLNGLGTLHWTSIPRLFSDHLQKRVYENRRDVYDDPTF